MKLNHVLIITSDLQAMGNFWTKVIGLEIGERPPFPFDGLWLYSEGTPFVHLAEQKGASFGYGSIAHLAFEGSNYKDLIFRLKQMEHPYSEKDVPLSGERQVFIAGPDGVTVEMLFPLNETQEETQVEVQVSAKTSAQSQSNKNYSKNENLRNLGGAK